ncbi:E3 ubiquitin-protein ligase TRIM31-like [Rhinoraja longicauda]
MRNTDVLKKESKLHCEEHQEELKLFCETDKKLICVVCAGGREHRDHRFILIDEAVENYKGQVKASIQSLTKDKSGIQQMMQQQKEKISGVLSPSPWMWKQRIRSSRCLRIGRG